MAKVLFLSIQASNFACMAVRIFPLLFLLLHVSVRERTCASCTGTKLFTRINVSLNVAIYNTGIEANGWSLTNLRLILLCQWSCLTKHSEQNLVCWGQVELQVCVCVTPRNIPRIPFVSVPFKTPSVRRLRQLRFSAIFVQNKAYLT